MIDEIKLVKERERAAHAKRLLDDPLLKEAFSKREADLIAGWIDTAPRDTDGRERAWTAIQANRAQRDYLSNIINMDGKLAEAELKAIEQVAQRKKRFGIV